MGDKQKESKLQGISLDDFNSNQTVVPPYEPPIHNPGSYEDLHKKTKGKFVYFRVKSAHFFFLG